LWCRGGTVMTSLWATALPMSLGGVCGRAVFALGGAVVTVEADVDAVERRLAAGELSCPACSSVLARWGRARPRQLRGRDGLGAVVSSPVAMHRLRGDACVVARERVAAPC
jgi:hypothetical protein